jgi:phosphoribosylamine--glycine ligase
VVTRDRDEARIVLNAFLEDRALGVAGSTVVVEECLTGPEVSVLALVDGETVRALAPSCDHKRAYDGDRGPNTGGMGAFAPTALIDDAIMADIRRTVLEPAARELARRGTPLQGALYAGLMMTPDGPKVLEFNARLGDPETQVVLPMLDGDLLELCEAVAHCRLAEVPEPAVRPGAAVGVVLASGGYPGPMRTGVPISGLEDVPDDVLVFHAGTRRDEHGGVLTAGGRVLTTVGLGDDLAAARDRAYAGAAVIAFAEAQARRDIGAREISPVS